MKKKKERREQRREESIEEKVKRKRKEKIKNVTHIKGKYCSCKFLIAYWVRFEIHFLLQITFKKV